MEFDIKEAIKQCEEKKQPNEIIVFALGAGRIVPLPGGGRKLRRAMKEAFDYIKSLDGFLGINPIDVWHTLLLFDSEMHGKQARNLLKAKGVEVGQVVPCLVNVAYLK